MANRRHPRPDRRWLRVRLWRVARPGLHSRDARTISLETGIQNGPLPSSSSAPRCRHAHRDRLSLCAEAGAAFSVHLLDLHVLQSVIVTTQVYMKQAGTAANHSGEKEKLLVGTTATACAARKCRSFTDDHALLPELPGGERTIPPAGGDAEDDDLVRHVPARCAAQRRCARLGTSRRRACTPGSHTKKWTAWCSPSVLVCPPWNAIWGILRYMSCNRVEWVVSMVAAHHYNFVIVPLYDTLGEEARRT